jgi:hypothetical protein
VWASTANPYYAIDGIRPGATLAAARTRFPNGALLHIGLNYWYLASHGSPTAVLKVRDQIVEEIGIADSRLTGTHRTEMTLMRSFY